MKGKELRNFPVNHQLIAAKLLGIDASEVKELISRMPPEKIFAVKMAVRRAIRGERTEDEAATKIKETIRKFVDAKKDITREA